MKLVDFVKQLPLGLRLAPIYRKGAKMESGRKAPGKAPLEIAWYKTLNRDDVAHQLEKNSELAAVGLFTGVDGYGIVILDVDFNLASLKRKWGDTLDGAPVVTSTRKNAAKYIFRVPEEEWENVSGFGHSDNNDAGYECLFKGHGVIFGAYPGSKDGKSPAGQYHFEGDPNNIPEAPKWLISEMRAAKAPRSFIKNRAALDFGGRTQDEIAQIVSDCLSRILTQGVGHRDHWIRIGMAIHSGLPNDTGLNLWSKWSKEDLDYAAEWESGKNPCRNVWKTFSNDGGITLGTLINEADKYDPERTRFDSATKKIVEGAEAAVQRTKEVSVSYEEIIRRGMAAYELEDTARMNYELHALAMEAKYKEQGQLEKLLLEHITQQNREPGHTMDKVERSKREFLIPGLLPYGYLLLLYGEPGCGKSATALALLKHVVDGVPFQLKKQLVPVKAGPVIYFNADMSSLDFHEEYELHEIKNGKHFHFEPDFNLYRQAQFVKKMNEVKPSMIVIDSLSSCSGAKAGDENKAEFAQPLYWLSTKNGDLWPACTIVVLHHTNKTTGAARGSSAIAAACSEAWSVERPKKDSDRGIDERVITIGKSRLNRSGETLIQTQNADLTVSLAEISKPEELQTRAGSVAERIMTRMQTHQGWMTRAELNSDALVGGSVSAVKKTLQRLVNRGLLETEALQKKQRGKPELKYRAISTSTRGESQMLSHVGEKPCNDSVSKGDTPDNQEGCPNKEPSPGMSKEDTLSAQAECPIKERSADAGSDLSGTLSHSPRARDQERTPSEISDCLKKANDFWD